MSQATFSIWRSEPGGSSGGFKDYTIEISDGMVVLDAVHKVQAEQAPHLACRWNCKAGKCGSCSVAATSPSAARACARSTPDNAIIPLTKRVVERVYDPVTRLLRMVTG